MPCMVDRVGKVVLLTCVSFAVFVTGRTPVDMSLDGRTVVGGGVQDVMMQVLWEEKQVEEEESQATESRPSVRWERRATLGEDLRSSFAW